MDAINIALQLAFILIFVIVLARFLRDPREVHRDLVLVFASVVALFAIAIARTVWPDMPRPITQLSSRRPVAPAVLHACGWRATSWRFPDPC